MAEYIERDVALKHKTLIPGFVGEYVSADRIKETPAADVVEVKHGRWIIPTKIGGRSFSVPHCSACNGVPCGVDEHTKYCPNCGAKMDGE